MPKDPDVIAAIANRREAETDEHFIKMRAGHDAAIAKHKGTRLIAELRMALSIERLWVSLLQHRVAHLLEMEKLMGVSREHDATIIRLLIERCTQAGVELPDSLTEMQRTQH